MRSCFLQLEDSNYMLGKIECMQTVTYAKLTLCTMFQKVSKSQKQIMASWILPTIECWGNFQYMKLPQRSFFGRIKDNIFFFWDLLTFVCYLKTTNCLTNRLSYCALCTWNCMALAINCLMTAWHCLITA